MFWGVGHFRWTWQKISKIMDGEVGFLGKLGKWVARGAPVFETQRVRPPGSQDTGTGGMRQFCHITPDSGWCLWCLGRVTISQRNWTQYLGSDGSLPSIPDWIPLCSILLNWICMYDQEYNILLLYGFRDVGILPDVIPSGRRGRITPNITGLILVAPNIVRVTSLIGL